MTAREYLDSIGRIELKNINGKTGEFIITPAELECFAKSKHVCQDCKVDKVISDDGYCNVCGAKQNL